MSKVNDSNPLALFNTLMGRGIEWYWNGARIPTADIWISEYCVYIMQ